MTQAMPPATPISTGVSNSPGLAKKSESQEDFSDTFRGQLEGESQDAPSDAAATSNGPPAQEQVGDESEAVAETSGPVNEAGAKSEPQQGSGKGREETAVESLAQEAQLIGVNAPAGVATQAMSVTGSQRVDAAVANIVLPTQAQQSLRGAAGASSGVAITARASSGKAEQSIVLSPSTTGQGAIDAGQLDASAVANAGKLLQGVARATELAMPPPAPAQVATPFAAALTPTPAVAANSFQALPSAALPLAVDTPLSNPNWGHAMAARVVWGATQGMQSASIEINPRELGPVSVNLRVVGDEASITFVSQHALVREAVEAALPRLRELFSGDGVNLGEVDISNGGGRSGHGDDTASANGTPSRGSTDAQAESSQLAPSHDLGSHRLDSLVDTFA